MPKDPSSNAGKRRITVDLGSAELYRTLKFAAVDKGVPARQIVVEALLEWLQNHYSITPEYTGRSHGG